MPRNNKKSGTSFEKELADILYNNGFWSHCIAPAPDGSQPFDVVAVKGNCAFVFECKVCTKGKFSADRIEDNQRTSVCIFANCQNQNSFFAFKNEEDGHIYISRSVNVFNQFQYVKSFNVCQCQTIEEWLCARKC
jgi:Holliday junction resolvase